MLDTFKLPYRTCTVLYTASKLTSIVECFRNLHYSVECKCTLISSAILHRAPASHYHPSSRPVYRDWTNKCPSLRPRAVVSALFALYGSLCHNISKSVNIFTSRLLQKGVEIGWRCSECQSPDQTRPDQRTLTGYSNFGLGG